jgi:hypothetical protein
LLTGSSLAAGQCVHSPLDTHKDRSECGPLIPMLIIACFAKVNFIDHSSHRVIEALNL